MKVTRVTQEGCTVYTVLEGLHGNVVVVGDFNMPSIDWDRNRASKSSEQGLVNLVEDSMSLNQLMKMAMFWTSASLVKQIQLQE